MWRETVIDLLTLELGSSLLYFLFQTRLALFVTLTEHLGTPPFLANPALLLFTICFRINVGRC